MLSEVQLGNECEYEGCDSYEEESQVSLMHKEFCNLLNNDETHNQHVDHSTIDKHKKHQQFFAGLTLSETNGNSNHAHVGRCTHQGTRANQGLQHWSSVAN